MQPGFEIFNQPIEEKYIRNHRIAYFIKFEYNFTIIAYNYHRSFVQKTQKY